MANNYKGRFATQAARLAYTITSHDLGHLFYDLSDGRSYRAIQEGAGASFWEAEESMFTGPSSATDNAIARFDGTGGETFQNSTATVSDTGAVYPADAQATEAAQTAAGLRAGSAAAAGGNAGDHYFKSDGTHDVNVSGTWYSRDGYWVVANEAALPTGADGDLATTTDDNLTWRNEGGNWVPQTLDIAKIVPSASQIYWGDVGTRNMGTDPDVASLICQFGSGNLLAQGTAGAMPHIDRDGPGGTQVVTFDGTDDALADATLASSVPATDWEVWVVVKSNAWQNVDGLFVASGGGTPAYLRQTTSSDEWELYVGASAATTDGANDSDWHIVRGFVTASTHGVQVDGGTPATATSVSPTANTVMTIGHDPVDGSRFISASVATVIVSGEVLSLGRRIALTRAINDRYKTQRLFAEPTA